MKVSIAKALYEHGDFRDPWHVGDEFSIEMLGWAKWVLRGNHKILDHNYTGHNTKFKGTFWLGHGKDAWWLDYSAPQNPWFVRQITDHVRFVGDDLGIGKFCWRDRHICWFVLRRCDDDDNS